MFKKPLVISSDLEKELIHFVWVESALEHDPDYHNKIKGEVTFDVDGEPIKHGIDLEVELVSGAGKLVCTTPFCSFFLIRKPYEVYMVCKAEKLEDLNKGNFAQQYFLPINCDLKTIGGFLHNNMFGVLETTQPYLDLIPDEMVTLTNLQKSRYYGLADRLRERSTEIRSAAPAFLLRGSKEIIAAAERELKSRKEAFGKSEGLLRRKVEMGQCHPFIGVKVTTRNQSGIVFATINDVIEFHKSDLGKDENDIEDAIILRRQMDEIFKANGSIWNAESISKLKDLLDSCGQNPLTEGTITIEHGTFDLVDELLSRDSNVKLSIRSRYPRGPNNSETCFAQMFAGAPLTEELAKMPNVIDTEITIPARSVGESEHCRVFSSRNFKPHVNGSLVAHSAGVIGGILSHSIPCLDSIIAKAKQSTPDVFYDTEGTFDVKKWSQSITLTAKQKSRMTSRQIKKHAKKNK